MRILVRLCVVSCGLVAMPSAAETRGGDDPEGRETGEEQLARESAGPPEWGAEGPYQLDVMLAIGIGARLDEPPLFEPDTRAVPAVETGLDLFLSRRLALFLHYQRSGLARESSGLLATGQVRLSRSVDTLWGGIRVDPLRSDAATGFLRLGAGLSWQHLEVLGLAWSPVTPAVQMPISCGATALGFGIRAAVGVDIPLAGGLRFVGEVGPDNHRLTSEVIGGCGPGAGTATIVGLRAGFSYGFPL